MRIVLGVVLSLLLATELHGCSCIGGGDAVAGVAAADAVFRAALVTTELVFVDRNGEVFTPQTAGETTGTLRRVAVLRVLERFKGDVGPFAILAMGSGAGDCGYVFEGGQTYLVYAQRTKDPVLRKVGGSPTILTTSICSFTAPVTDADETLTRIRKIYRSVVPTFYKPAA